MDVPEAILVNIRPVTVHPDILPARPVGFEITVWVFPEASRHPRPGLRDHEFSHLPAHRLALLVKAVRGHARDRPIKGARLDGRVREAPEDATRDFRAPGVIDDWHLATAHVLEEPHVGLRIPRLSC